MKRLLLYLCLILSLCSCYTVNPDGSLNVPQKTLGEIEGEWVGFNENTLLGCYLKIEKDGSGHCNMILFNQAGDASPANFVINNNVLTATLINEDKKAVKIVFELEPTLMLLSADQQLEQIKFKMVLRRKEQLLQQLKMLSAVPQKLKGQE